jgi:transcriptional regulator with XRE-family HTH domain
LASLNHAPNWYEKGVHAPDFKTVKALAHILEVPTAFLYCIEDELAEKILYFCSK